MELWLIKSILKISIIFFILLYWERNESHKEYYFDIRSVILNKEIWLKRIKTISNPFILLFIIILTICSCAIFIMRISLILLLIYFFIKYAICYFRKKSFVSYYDSSDVKFYPSILGILWNLWLQLYFSAHNIFYISCFILKNKIRPKINVLLIICNVLVTVVLGFPFICLIVSFDITQSIAAAIKQKYKIKYIKFAILENLNNLILTKFPYQKDFPTASTHKIHFIDGIKFNPKGILVSPTDVSKTADFFINKRHHIFVYPDVIDGKAMGISGTSHPKEWMKTMPMYGRPQSGKSVAVINEIYDTGAIDDDTKFVENIAFKTGIHNAEVREFLLNNAMQVRFLEEMEIRQTEFDRTVTRIHGRYFERLSENQKFSHETRKIAEMVENQYYKLPKKDLINMIETHNILMDQYNRMIGSPFEFNDFVQLKKDTYTNKNFEDYFKLISKALSEFWNN